jgi:hypothetical protein
LSRPVLAEYRSVLRRPSLVDKYPELQHPRVRDAIERILFVGPLSALCGGCIVNRRRPPATEDEWNRQARQD